MNKLDVFSIVLNWNLPYSTIACVESILSGTHIPQIVIIDNGSTDNSLTILRQHFSHRHITILPLPSNRGFAVGMNAGIQYALSQRAKWILLLNNDVILAPDTINLLIQEAENNPPLDIAAPAIFYYDEPNKIWNLGSKDFYLSPVPVSFHAFPYSKNKIMVDYVTGCTMLVRSSVFQEIGLFDKHYFMYYEDAEFCRRAKLSGFRIGIIPYAYVWHKVSLSTKRNLTYRRFLQSRSRVYFYNCYYSLYTLMYLWFRFLFLLSADLLLHQSFPLFYATLKGVREGIQLSKNCTRKHVHDGSGMTWNL